MRWHGAWGSYALTYLPAASTAVFANSEPTMETKIEEVAEAAADTERETISDVPMVALITSARPPVRHASRTTTASSPIGSNAGGSRLGLLSLKHGGGTVSSEGSCRSDEKARSHCERLAICGMKALPQSPRRITVMAMGIGCRAAASHSDALSYARLGVTSVWMFAVVIPSRVFVTARAKSRRRSVACDCSCRCRCTSVHISAEPFSSRLNGGSEVASSPGDISTVNSM